MPQSDDSADTLPPIAALFLVVFDRKVGYTIAWQRSLPEVELEGVVEYKSLPSGLHNVESDLIYFTHDKYAGLSAFVSKAASEEERNANFVSVGILVPQTYGRLGRAWMHAQRLRELASSAIDDMGDYSQLEPYWKVHKLQSLHDDIKTSTLAEPSSPVKVRNSKAKDQQPTRSRALSDVTGYQSKDHVLSPDHPALSMPDLLEAFGPLTFPVYRAALLRKRILIMGSPPIQKSCDYVYDLSIFSNIPPSLVDLLPSSTSLLRIRPLLNIGIHDLTSLLQSPAKDSNSHGEDEGDSELGWLACTTDDILSTKRGLYDVLIELPAAQTDKSTTKKWPIVRTADGVPVKATQRDLRRYRALRGEVRRMRREQTKYSDDADHEALTEEETDTERLLNSALPADQNVEDQIGPPDGEVELVEASSWASIAYSSFLWWATSGEKDIIIEEEQTQDAHMLEDLPFPTPDERSRSRSRASSKGKRSSVASRQSTSSRAEDVQGLSMVLSAYFHRLTALIMETMAEIVAAADDETEDGVSEAAIVIESEDIRRMGLDVWSPADKHFLREMVRLYFLRETDVRSVNVECCGMKIL